MRWFEWLFKYPYDALTGGQFTFLVRIRPEWLLLSLGAIAVAVWWMYRRVSGKLSPNRRWLLIALRVAFFGVLLFVLAIPAVQARRQRSGPVFTAVVVDTSRSMSIADVDVSGGTKPRFEVAGNLLADHAGAPGLLSRFAGDNQDQSRVLCYGFDRDARRLPGLKDLKADGTATNIFKAMKDVEADTRGMPLGSVVLFTDGGRNAGGTLDEAANIFKTRGVPMYIVGLGNPNPPPHYEVVQVYAPRQVRRNSEVEVQAAVRSVGLRAPFEVQVSRDKEMLVSKTVQPADGSIASSPPSNADLQTVRLKFTPDHDGPATYRVSIPPAKGSPNVAAGANALAFREFSLDVRDDRLPVLYIEGSPRPEYRYLRRAMLQDKDFRLVGLLRLDNKGRFYIQGANDSEKYLEKGFPATQEQLFAFQAVILGDIESSFFTAAQLQLLEEFVRVRGGGLIMLGGVNSFGPGGYGGTPVGKMLPLDVSQADGAYSDATYSAAMTEDGLKHPVMQLSNDPVANKRLWESAPPLMGITPTGGVKVGGNLLLKQEKTGLPVLAVQNYGGGRVAAFTSGGSWYWRMSRPADEVFFEKFWKQLTRWLVVGAKEQLTVEMKGEIFARREPVVIQAGVSARDLRPINDATVLATITDPLGNKRELPMDWVLSQEGVYECSYTPEEEGNYAVSVRVEGNPNFAEKAAVQTEFLVSQPMAEFNDSAMKEDALRQMARATGGRYFTLAEASKLPDEVRKAAGAARTAGMKSDQRQIWDMPVVLAVLLTLCAAEWILRRRGGLA